MGFSRTSRRYDTNHGGWQLAPVQTNNNNKQAWNFHPPTPQFVADNYKVKYDTRFWGNQGKPHASFPKYAFPFQSKFNISPPVFSPSPSTHH